MVILGERKKINRIRKGILRLTKKNKFINEDSSLGEYLQGFINSEKKNCENLFLDYEYNNQIIKSQYEALETLLKKIDNNIDNFENNSNDGDNEDSNMKSNNKSDSLVGNSLNKNHLNSESKSRKNCDLNYVMGEPIRIRFDNECKKIKIPLGYSCSNNNSNYCHAFNNYKNFDDISSQNAILYGNSANTNTNAGAEFQKELQDSNLRFCMDNLNNLTNYKSTDKNKLNAKISKTINLSSYCSKGMTKTDCCYSLNSKAKERRSKRLKEKIQSGKTNPEYQEIVNFLRSKRNRLKNLNSEKTDHQVVQIGESQKISAFEINNQINSIDTNLMIKISKMPENNTNILEKVHSNGDNNIIMSNLDDKIGKNNSDQKTLSKKELIDVEDIEDVDQVNIKNSLYLEENIECTCAGKNKIKKSSYFNVQKKINGVQTQWPIQGNISTKCFSDEGFFGYNHPLEFIKCLNNKVKIILNFYLFICKFLLFLTN